MYILFVQPLFSCCLVSVISKNVYIVCSTILSVSKLRAAVISGVVVLVTHMERRRLSKKLALLLSRQTFVDKNKDMKIAIGKSIVTYHPSFRLFLSSSMPLYMKGDGLVPLPLSKTCVIDMTLGQEGLASRLLLETLTLERPEYEGQKKSLERDLSLHQHQILAAQVLKLYGREHTL